MAKPEAPPRPASVPPDARWVEEDREWESGGLSRAGKKHGQFRYWRADGTLCNECVLREGKPHGPFKRFHESGEVSQEGRYVDGELHGLRVWHGTDQPTTEQRLAPGMGEAVWRSEMKYDMGRVVSVRHFDRAGKRVCPDGSPYPARPGSVGESAEYHPEDAQWVELTVDRSGQRHGKVRVWSRDGALLEEAEYEHGKRHGVARLFGPGGAVREEGRFREDERTGVFRTFGEGGALESEREYHGDALEGLSERYGAGGEVELEEHWARGVRHGAFRQAGGFRDLAVSALEGEWDQGAPAGTWSFLAADGRAIRTMEFEPRRTSAQLAGSPVFSDVARTAEGWESLAVELEAEGRRGEALVARARAAATSLRVQPLLDALEHDAVPWDDAHADAAYDEAARDGEPGAGRLLELLRLGATPARVLRALAVRLDQGQRSRAALDLVNAALLLAPSRVEALFTRALVLMSLGLDARAEADAQTLAPSAPEDSEFLLTYVRVLFPTFDFWPARTKPHTTYDGLPERPARTLDEVRDAVQRYATRLQRVREALLRRVRPGVRWVPPDLAALLPKGAVELRQFEFEAEGEGDDGGTISVDEEMGLEALAAEPEVPALLRTARGDWAALCWLCWSAGLKEVAVPRRLAPPRAFGAAAGMSAQRLWRCRDRRLTGGAGARASGAPGFTWEDVEIDELPPPLVSMPEAEWAEVQALMKWLAYEHARSPWQDDLRGS